MPVPNRYLDQFRVRNATSRPVTLGDLVNVTIGAGKTLDLLKQPRVTKDKINQSRDLQLAFQMGVLVRLEEKSTSLKTRDERAATIADELQGGTEGTGTGTGIDGAVGPTGPQGEIGATGPAGGPQGPQGEIGVTGPEGQDGATGPAGSQGIQGELGPTGPVGPAGGPTGPIGPTGPAGTDGIIGIDGVTGPAGPVGATGPAGTGGGGSLAFKELNAVGQSAGDLNLTDSNWGISKSRIDYIRIDVTGTVTDFDIAFYESATFYDTDIRYAAATLNSTDEWQDDLEWIYIDNESTDQIHLRITENTGTGTYDIHVRGVELL